MQLAFRRLPIRLRLTVAFAGVLTSVLAVGGLLLFTQFRGDFDNVIDESLGTRAADAAALVATSGPHAAPNSAGTSSRRGASSPRRRARSNPRTTAN